MNLKSARFAARDVLACLIYESDYGICFFASNATYFSYKKQSTLKYETLLSYLSYQKLRNAVECKIRLYNHMCQCSLNLPYLQTGMS